MMSQTGYTLATLVSKPQQFLYSVATRHIRLFNNARDVGQASRTASASIKGILVVAFKILNRWRRCTYHFA